MNFRKRLLAYYCNGKDMMSVLNGILLGAALTDTVSTDGYIFVIKHLYLGTRFTAVYQVYSHPSITAPAFAPPPFTVH